MKMYKSLCTVLAAATLSYSAPGWGNTSALSCEERVQGAVRIEKSDACTDRFGVIYDAKGDKLQNLSTLVRIQRSREYIQAQEGAKALYMQMEAVRQRETSSKLEERVQKEDAPPPYLQPGSTPATTSESTSDLPPPYLRPGYQEPAPNVTPSGDVRPSYTNTSPSSASEQSVRDKTSNILTATLFGLGGMSAMALGLGVMVDNGACVAESTYYKCEEPDNSLAYALMISGVVSLGVSLYFLAK